MNEGGLGDFFKLIAEDKRKKKEEFDSLVGEINLDSVFSEFKESIAEDKKNSKKVKKQVEAFESWLKSETEEEKEEIVAEVADDFKEEVDTTDWRDDYVPTEIETEDLVKPEPLKPTPSVIDQSIKILDELTEEVDPLNDTKFATFDDLKKHYQLFLDRISVQLSSLGGGGIEDAPKTGGPYARRNQAWEVISSSGGSSVWEIDSVGINTTKNVGIGTTAKDGYSLYVEGDARITGILTVGRSSVTIDGIDDKIIIGSGTTITEGGNAEFVGVVTASSIRLTGGTIGVTSESDKTDTALAIERNTFIRSVEPAGGVSGAFLRNLIGKSENHIQIGHVNTGFVTCISLYPGSSGSVQINHGGPASNTKLETTGYGVTVTGIASATNVSIANTFTYPPHITGGTVPRAIKSQGGYDRSSAFVDYQTGTEASQDPADYIEYTQELADSETWYRFGMSTAGNQARDNQWWGETNPNYDNTKGLFGGLTDPAGVSNFFAFSENTAFNNAQTTGSLKYTQALGSFSLKDCQVGDLVLARFDFNVMPMVTNTTVQVALIYANRDENDAITFTFPLTITPFFYGSGSVGKGFLLRPTITAYMANQQDVNSRSLVAIKADNPILVNPIGVLFTIQR